MGDDIAVAAVPCCLVCAGLVAGCEAFIYAMRIIFLILASSETALLVDAFNTLNFCKSLTRQPFITMPSCVLLCP